MFGGGCTARILLEPNPKQYYVTGDVVSGTIDLHTSGMYSVTDVQVKLRCDEYSVATYYTESDRRRERRERNARSTGFIKPLRQAAQQQALKQIGKAGNFDEDTMQIVGDGLKMIRERKKHYQLTTNAFSTAADEEKTMLSQGHHTYPFSFRLSEAVNKCPPYAPISASHGLKIGVIWTVKAVVRRPGRFQSDIREVIRVPVYPDNPHRSHIDFTRRKTVSGSGEGSGGRITAHLTYPEAGIPQNGHPIPLGLEVSVDGKHNIRGVECVLVQNCISKAKGLKENHTDSIQLGATGGSRMVNESRDWSPYLRTILLESFIAPTLSLTNVKVSYELLVTIEDSHHSLEVRTPITVLSPADTAPLQISRDKDTHPAMPPKYTRSSSVSSSPPSDHTHNESSYVLPDESPYWTSQSSQSSSQKGNNLSVGSSCSVDTERSSVSSARSKATTEQRKPPPLPPRVPLDAPPYPPRPRHSDSSHSVASTPDYAGGPLAISRPHSPTTEASLNVRLDNEPETWYPGLQNGYGPSLGSSMLNSHSEAASSLSEQPGRLLEARVEHNVTGSTDSTLVEPISSLEGLNVTDNDEHEPLSTAGLPSYDDAVRSQDRSL